ncbi:MAG: glycosyltransferase [Nitriliruptorales bacterium]|nr:glycosyltransferase [Nitriliruptorales bacterium]
MLDVPDLGTWTPFRPVSLVLPYYQAPRELSITLAALARQSYPMELLEVVVADDGSNPPLELEAGDHPFDLVVVHQEDLGFGLARARNTGAKAASGEILVFIDCDMVPEPWHVEAHARWHHVASDALTIGFRRHVEFDEITPEMVRDAAGSEEGLEGLLGSRDWSVPEWIERHMVRTNELTSDDDDLFRVAAGGNLGIRKETYFRLGGSDESFTQWGAEDIEFGFRAFTDGLLFVPERAALCWHQGEGEEPSPSEVRSLEDQRAKISHLIAHRGFRRSVAGRSFAVPRATITIRTGDESRDIVLEAVESWLASSFHDLLLLVDLPADHPDAVWLTRQLDPDPRVTVAEAPDADRLAPFTPVHVETSAQVAVEPETLGRLVALLEGQHPLGVVHSTIRGRSPRDEVLIAWARRAWSRATRVADRSEDVAEVAGELFGERWVPGSDLGIRLVSEERQPIAADAPVAPGSGAGISAAEVSDLQQLALLVDAEQRGELLAMARQVLGPMSDRQRRLLLRVAKRIALLVAATLGLFTRTGKPFGARLADLFRAMLPWAIYRRLRSVGVALVSPFRRR